MNVEYNIPPAPDQKVADPAEFTGIVMEGVSKSFGSKQVLNDTDLLIHKGETLVVIGRSGEGKSVLLKHIVRLLEPDAGRIWVEGVEISEMEMSDLMEMRKKFGFLFQGAALFDSMDICKNVGLMLEEHSGWPMEKIRARACEALAMVGLMDSDDKLPSELSGGMKKRAGLARAIALDPDVLFFDEPSAGLDPVSAHLLDQLIMQLRDSLGATVIMVTHELESIFAIGNNSVFLDPVSKTQITMGDPKQILKETRNPAVIQFLTRGKGREST